MTQLVIQNDDLADRLREIAQRENRPVEEVLSDLLDLYSQDRRAAFEAMDGMFDDDVTDLSTTIRETMDSFWLSRSV